MLYLSLKWLHIIAIISWMAGILYLFRLFVNHVDYGTHNVENHKLLMGMEYRLYRYITVPAMMVAWIAGISMISISHGLLLTFWLQVKLITVLLLTLCTLYAGKLVKTFSTENPKVPSGKTLRFINEVPTLLMMIIIAMVVFRPSL